MALFSDDGGATVGQKFLGVEKNDMGIAADILSKKGVCYGGEGEPSSKSSFELGSFSDWRYRSIDVKLFSPCKELLRYSSRLS